MKHDGIIPSDEADKLYSYPALSGDSDTFLNGAGDFDHPHEQHFSADPTNSVDWTTSLAVYGNVNWLLRTEVWNVPAFQVDKYGHIIKLSYKRNRILNATTTVPGFMSADDKVKLDAYPVLPSDASLVEITLADGSAASVVAVLPSEG